jgi:tellurite resistance protein TehA-like permease
MSRIPLSAGAVVMGTGIVSVGLHLDHYETLSRIMLVIAAAVSATIALAIVDRRRCDPQELHREIRSPDALTAVAGSAVLGARLLLLGWTWAGAVLLLIAAIVWLTLWRPVLASWATPTVGVSLMLVVSTASLAVLSAGLGARRHAAWLDGAAMALLVLGLGLYAFVMAHFDFRQLIIGQGDQWITGGALAVSTLAAGQIALAHQLGSLHQPLRIATIALWAVTMSWLGVLLIAEGARPRLRYHERRWSTVFPLGMYAACSFLVGTVARATAITEFARVWIWVAVTVWLAVSVGTIRRVWLVVSGPAR